MRTRNGDKHPVLLLGWVQRIVVSVARSLHQHGISVDVANFASGPEISSHAIRHFTRLPPPHANPAAFLSSLCELIERGGHDMVFPTDDQALVALTNHHEYLKSRINLACPPPATIRLALDKSETLRIGRECGIRVPETCQIFHATELAGMVAKIPFPWILKASQKLTEAEQTKTMIVTNRDQVAHAFPHACTFSPPMLLQELCPGEGVGIEILLHKGECRALFQHRRVLEFPHTGGYSVSAIAEPPNPVLVKQSLELLRAMQWEGPAMVEFKINPADGSAILMEVNGRYWGSISLAIAAGVDFPLYHWQLAHSQEPAIPKTYRDGTRWRWTGGHIYRLHDLLVASRRSKTARRVLIRSLLELPLAFSPTVYDALFRWTDPLPFFSDVGDGIRSALRYDWEVLCKRMPAFLIHSSAK